MIIRTVNTKTTGTLIPKVGRIFKFNDERVSYITVKSNKSNSCELCHLSLKPKYCLCMECVGDHMFLMEVKL